MRHTLLFLLLLGCYASVFSQGNALWLRYPSISPDGKTIAFGYKGDIYRVDANGGVATPLTIHEAHDMMPVWSHDGKTIAFASDRYGDFDVFVMPATGGAPTRLTFNSAHDYPYDFTRDNNQVLFGSGRTAPSTSSKFPSPRLFRNVYLVPVKGGKSILVSAAGMDMAKYNNDGSRIVFEDRKGYEDPWRKHHTSSVTRDIWIYNIKANSYKKISGYNGEDRNPLFADNENVFYLSEKGGISQNVFKSSIADPAKMEQLTSFKDHPVRHLSKAADNTLCFTYNGEIYTLKPGGRAQKVAVNIFNDGREAVEKVQRVNGNVTEFAVSPNGKEIAFVTRGEVFVTSVEGSQTKRITNTPEQERMVQWAPDGRSLIYAAERNDNWDIYTISITRKEEPYFFASTVLKEEPLIATNAEEFLPKYSPDGKEVAYWENRNVLRVYNIASKKSRTLIPQGRNYSYADGDINFNWSPDGKYLLASDQYFGFDGGRAGMVKADGTGSILHPVMSGFGEARPKWAMNGKAITWANNKEGRRSLAFQGAREMDVYALFFDQEAFDRFQLSKEDFDLLKEKEERAQKSKPAADSAAKKAGEKRDSAIKTWSPDLTDLESRKLKLTTGSATISDYALSPDGSKLYYLAAVEKGYDLWLTEPRTRQTRLIAKLGSSGSGIEMSKDGKNLFVNNRGSIMKVDEMGKTSPVSINTEMIVNNAAEREYIFNHAWRQVKAKFYDPKIHGINWEKYKKDYAVFLPHISNNYDFQELLSELLGELNGSHTGGRYNPQFPNGDNTASIGAFFDETYTGNGMKVTEIIRGGPLFKAASKIRPGHIIEKVDGTAITAQNNWDVLLNRKDDQDILISIFDPVKGARWEETVKPISGNEEGPLLYKRWVKMMSDMVDSLSGGKLGYVHVQGMNDGSYRTVVDEVMGKHRQKEGLVVDTRFNGGGWLHNDLNTFLSGKAYFTFAPQSNRLPVTEPIDRWSKPSIVLMSEGNYSDAHLFPYSYKNNGIGKLVGMPVPGTGTAVWWETQIDPTIVFGIPMIAVIGKENRPVENLQLEPDIKVELDYESFLSGKDPQLEAAVKELMKK
ncbi:S41 family peptidase [Pseudoflavitalea rhizosphaerae]|uniref:S41 family peptidase n=1 Tax=Pseudoflavitalea rhizosphaerae TaxID=1884793 RepID=UPI000F8F52F5|nr:S41 family peptidase [Pseudoflavitalea rhizosphaerae]